MGVAASRDYGINYCTTPYFLLLDGHMRFYDAAWSSLFLPKDGILPYHARVWAQMDGLYLGAVRKLGCKQQAYAHSFVNLKRKKGISATPLN